MKRTKQCPKCESRAIAYLERVMVPPHWIQDPKEKSLDPNAWYTSERIEGHRVLARSRTKINTGALDYGKVHKLVLATEVYICTACGLTEEYVRDLPSIDWNDVEGLAWVHPPPDERGPFR